MTEPDNVRVTQELLPCPFCGGDELSHGWSSPGYDGSMHSGNVECHSCGALIIAGTEHEAIAVWNRRAGIPDPAAFVAAFEGLYKAASRVWRAETNSEVTSEKECYDCWVALEEALTAARAARGEG